MKCGNTLYKGVAVPKNAEIKISAKGLEYYISGIHENQAYIKFIESGQIIKVSLSVLNKS